MTANPALISKDIVDLQDIEKIQFLQSLQSDPAKYASYVAEKKGRIVSEVVDAKRAAYMKVSADMARMMDMDLNSQAALNRTNDLGITQDHIITQQASFQGAKKRDLDMTRRQVEINNWYYENKRETLFLLQILMLTLLTVTVGVGLQATGYISTEGANFLMAFVIIVGAGTWLYRWYYTTRLRDPRYWSQRQFPGESKAGTGEICIGYTAEAEKKPQN